MKAIHNLRCKQYTCKLAVSDRKDTKLLKAIHNVGQLADKSRRAVSDRKDTKLLKAIHNGLGVSVGQLALFQTAKIQNF